MKRIIAALFWGAFLLGLCSPQLRAEDKPAARKAAPEKHEEMGKKFKEKLGLSDEQAEKMKTAMKAHHDAVKPLREIMRQGMDKLRKQIKDNAGEDDLKATLNELDQTRKAMLAEMENLKTNMAGILTTTQRAKMLVERMGHGEGRWKNHQRRGDGPHGDDEDDEK